jgi:23S rRNA (cytosine1962-C5)-methyltransferase
LADNPDPSTPTHRVPTVRLKKGVAKPLHGGHPWVFADAIFAIEGTDPKPGDEVRVADDRGTCLGRGFFSPDSAIAVRLITRADAPVTDALLISRIEEALRLRRDVLDLGVETQVTAPANLSAPADPRVKAVDDQLLHVQKFAAQYGMDATEETAELRKRRAELAPGAPQNPAPVQKNTDSYRLINSEGDGLPGLTVDVYGDYLAMQIGTAGMDRRLETILNALQERLNPKGILDRSDARSRQIERLDPPRQSALRGKVPDGPEFVRENGIELRVDLRPGQGQKTGLYLDQRENRLRFAGFAANKNVLDVFSYSGGFSLYAARAGAKSITLIESSDEALQMAQANMERNGVTDADLVNAEYAEGFKHLREGGRMFDLMVVDPPKFARGRDNVAQALTAYRDLNAQAVRLLSPGGLLFTCSCSGNVSETDFERAVASGIRASGRRAALLERRGAGPDHPVPPGFDQGRYLKCLVLQIA